MACTWAPRLHEIKILGRSARALGKELLEAYHIKSKSTEYISNTPLCLFIESIDGLIGYLISDVAATCLNGGLVFMAFF